MKKLKLMALGLISLCAVNVSAANISATDSLKDCLESSSETECILTEDYTLTEAINVYDSKVLNLNGKYLELDDSITIQGSADLIIKGNGEIYSDSVDLFLVKEGGFLTIEDGTHMTEAVNGSIVYVKGGNVDTALATKVDIGKSAKLIANKAIAIGQNGNYAYGVNVTVDGTLQGITGNNSYYLGAAPLYINGNIKKVDTNVPTIIINKTAKIIGGQTGDTNEKYIGKSENVSKNDAASPAVFAAGYAKWIINGGEFYGDEALSIKSGEFIINGGTFTAKGELTKAPLNNGNGSETTGATISITANDGYEGNVLLTINDGEFISEKGYALFEGDTDAGKDAVDEIKILGGNFEGKEGAVDSTNETAFISGGTYNTEIESYVAKDLEEIIQEGVHYVGTKNKVNVVIEGEGSASANLNEAIKGQTIKLMVSPADGNKIKDVIVTANGNEIEYINYTFSMPNEDVEVKVVFEKEEVKIEDNEKEEVSENNKENVEDSKKDEEVVEDNKEIVEDTKKDEDVIEDTTKEDQEVIIDNTDDKKENVEVDDEKEESKVDSTESEKTEDSKPNAENPETNDTVIVTLTILAISLLGVISTLYIKKKYN